MAPMTPEKIRRHVLITLKRYGWRLDVEEVVGRCAVSLARAAKAGRTPALGTVVKYAAIDEIRYCERQMRCARRVDVEDGRATLLPPQLIEPPPTLLPDVLDALRRDLRPVGLSAATNTRWKQRILAAA